MNQKDNEPIEDGSEEALERLDKLEREIAKDRTKPFPRFEVPRPLIAECPLCGNTMTSGRLVLHKGGLLRELFEGSSGADGFFQPYNSREEIKVISYDQSEHCAHCIHCGCTVFKA